MRVSKKRLLDFVRANDGVTFREIEHFFNEQGYDYRGDAGLSLGGMSCVVWNGWNRRTCHAFMELVSCGKLVLYEAETGDTPPIFCTAKNTGAAGFVKILIKVG